MSRKKIQNYQLIEVVGEGSYGKVFRSKNIQTNQQFAIKIVPKSKFIEFPQLENTTMQQIGTLSKLKETTHIVRYIQLLKTANNYYFVYEFCNGGTLDKAIKAQGRFTQAKAFQYFKQLLSAFKVLNRNKIIHRDLKPDNIFLHNGILKIGDFGFCKAMQNSEQLAKTMLGSPLYMAPEVLKNQVYTSKADIWSLGVVLYEMLFGHCPFESSNIYNLMVAIQTTELKIPPNSISKECQGLIRKMLVKDQFQRVDWNVLLDLNISEDGRILPACDASNNRPPSITIRQDPSDSWRTMSVSESSSGNIARSVKSSDSSNLKKPRSEVNTSMNRKRSLEDHLSCMKAVLIAGNFIREMHTLGFPFAHIILRAVETRLQSIPQDVFKTNDEIIEVRRNIADIEKALPSFDRDLVKSPKSFLKSRFRGEQDSQLALWAQMVAFLRGDCQEPTIRQDMVALVNQYLS